MMLLSCVLSHTWSYAQDLPLEVLVQKLKIEINQAEGAKKLQLLDSLSYITRDKIQFKYDSIVKETVAYAIELDSFDLANRQAARLVWSLTNRLGKPNEAKAFFEDFDAKNLPIKDNRLLARFYLNGGDSYYFSEAVEKSIEVYRRASNYAIKAGDSIMYGISKKYIADAYAKMGNLVDASRMLQEVEAIYVDTKDTIRLVNTKSSRADLYSMNGFYDEAKIERDEVIELAKAIQYDSGLISALLNAAIDDYRTENYEQEILRLNQALEYARNSKEVKDRYEPQILNRLLEEYAMLDSIGKATEILKQIQEKPERYTKGLFEDQHIKGLAYYHLAKQDYNKALENAQIYYDLQIKNNTVERINGAHDLLFQIYEALNKPEEALFHYKKASQLRDSVFSLERTKVLSYYQTLYETEKRDAKIASQQSEITILDTKNKVKQQWILFGGLGLLICFVLIYLLKSKQYVQNKNKLQEQFSQDLINEQENERSRLAMELHDSVGQKLMLLTKKTKKINDQGMEALAEGTLEELRAISRGLHPAVLNRFGFTKAVSTMIDEMDNNSDMFFTLEIENIDAHISKESAIHLYRMIQESLNNILKHSKAKAVSVDIERKGENIKTTIQDNGLGFEVADAIDNPKSLGMKTLLKRAKIIKSKIHIHSVPNTGTTVNITTPIYGI